MSRNFLVFVILAVTQVTGWGAVGILPVVAARIAADFHVELPTIFAGTSVMFVAMGVAAPAMGRAFRRFGARRIMALGAALIGCGLGLVAAAPSSAVFLSAWAIVGLAGAMFLTTAAYVYLAAFAGERARGMIGSLMLVTGFAGSLFWPLTAFLDHALGWRGAVFAYSGAMIVLVAPLVLFGLPETAGAPSSEPAVAGGPGKGQGETQRRRVIFILLVAAIALNSFVTFGIEAIGIELFRAFGADLARAVAIASLLGFFKVGGRTIDLLGGNRWDGLSTALVSGAMIPAGLLIVFAGRDSFWSVAGYLVLFGVGSGAFAVARATMPLVFFRSADYAAAMSTIALPMNLINALAPPVLAGMMIGIGPRAVLALLAALSVLAYVTLLALNRLRPVE